MSLLALVERQKPGPAANPSDWYIQVTVFVPKQDQTPRSKSPSSSSKLMTQNTTPSLSDLPGTQQGGGSPLAGKGRNEAARCVEPKGMKKISQDREDLSDFDSDILNIFRRRWFLSRDKLVANVISAQKAEDGKFSWVEFEPAYHSHLVKVSTSGRGRHSGALARADALQSPLAAPSPTPSKFSVQTFTQLLDHFYNTDATFQQCFWVNTRHYKPRSGAPAIVIDGGETSGEDRLPFLDTGILARAIGGIAVVLEYSTTLNDEQALEDSANLNSQRRFEDIDEDFTAPNTPWIYYDGSYVGARAAHMRVLYPDLVFGAIASSDIIRLAADPKYSSNPVKIITIVDSLLKFAPLRGRLKKLFGLSELESDKDFVSVITFAKRKSKKYSLQKGYRSNVI
ncbi:hypothetical protein BJV78DRAFT_1285481 [Lactifluus subvellereus]|nr:hypothetical protein BJV78DRAFT_1285481 [Lactifluus subvellereus]